MSIGISDEHVELAASMRTWAGSLKGIDVARAVDAQPAAAFGEVWASVVEMGVATIGLPESVGGGGGTALDVAVALEACAHELVPGALLSTVVAMSVLAPVMETAPGLAEVLGSGASFGLALDPALAVVWDAPGATHLLLSDADDQWYVVPATAADVTGLLGLDLTRRYGSARVDLDAAGVVRVAGLSGDLVRRTAITFAAAEAAGVARWCLKTAVDHAKVREQFGKPIGSFQAIKHLCAEMLETAEAVTAAAWDVASAAFGDEEQWAFAVDVASVVAFDGAVSVAKSCIQVLGGIGFTYEHEAHFYLRRALTLRGLLGSADEAALSLTASAVAGTRRRVAVDLDGRDDAVREEIASLVDRVAAAGSDQLRAGLVDTGLLTPHWPAPYGLGADAVTQLVIDQELARARVERPDIVIAGWALPTILEHGTPEQRERLVRPSLLGELTWCQLFSEPGSGSDLASLRTRASRVEGGWRLSGQKVWTSVAQKADWGICLARTDADVPQHQGISYFLVDMRSAGIDVRPLREITGEALFNEVFLDDVFVPDDCLVAGEGDGWRLARTTLANERVAMATSRLDKSTERAVALASAGSGSSTGVGPGAGARAGAAVGMTVAERVRIGRAVALSTVCSLLGTRSTLRSLAGQGPGAESSVAKLLGVRNRQDGAELVVELYGDRLVTDDPDVRAAVWEMLNTRCLSIAGGTTQILRNIVGERILGLPR
ncbi:acyl-CoA dehydrogenase [Nocardioides psychrotolerans]|uniref:Acyl-CoA dehydrogenase n=1 Tax=Nocardioides psychrotolerans TaxID=1005945 RepID=A0A1I3FX72_9ACTN|nr:acyl-CoA dehydrogenase [Nocardioides psychrotolerans]GEP37358.1 acyl-CoA dehydrogenase [Nocardioides psychrotolerans]SFI15826.1 Acyl-CoA dehydrogenase [Nocardioides psychrotolerans]